VLALWSHRHTRRLVFDEGGLPSLWLEASSLVVPHQAQRSLGEIMREKYFWGSA
jgi:hypothetical protein